MLHGPDASAASDTELLALVSRMRRFVPDDDAVAVWADAALGRSPEPDPEPWEAPAADPPLEVAGHDILVWGPNDPTSSEGRPQLLAGYVWCCSCKASGNGYPTEAEAEDAADAHLADVAPAEADLADVDDPENAPAQAVGAMSGLSAFDHIGYAERYSTSEYSGRGLREAHLHATLAVAKLLAAGLGASGL